MICGQKVALGRAHQHQTVTIAVSEATLAIEFDDQEVRVLRRTTTLPIRNIKRSASCAAPPPCRSVTSTQTGHGRPSQFPRAHVADQVAQQRRASAGTRQKLMSPVPSRLMLDTASHLMLDADTGGLA
jgi:hypothetical protein